MGRHRTDMMDLARREGGSLYAIRDELFGPSAKALYQKGLSILSGRPLKEIQAAMDGRDKLAEKAIDLADARAEDGWEYQPHCIRSYAGVLGEGWGES